MSLMLELLSLKWSKKGSLLIFLFATCLRWIAEVSEMSIDIHGSWSLVLLPLSGYWQFSSFCCCLEQFLLSVTEVMFICLTLLLFFF